MLPCRDCSNKQVPKSEVRWPARCFVQELTQVAMWKQILLGCDMLCYRCQELRKPKRKTQTRFLLCEQCQDLVRRGLFSADMQRRWDARESGEMLCQRHESSNYKPSNAAAGETGQCTKCLETWPENCFPAEELRSGSMELHPLCWICFAEQVHPDRFNEHQDRQCSYWGTVSAAVLKTDV